MGIDRVSIPSKIGLVCFGDRRRVDILSFLGVERIRSLLELQRRRGLLVPISLRSLGGPDRGMLGTLRLQV